MSWLGFWLKMFSLLSSGSLAEFGSSERYRVRLGQDPDLIPQLGEVLPHLRRGGLAGVRIAVDRKVDQQGVTRRQVQRRTTQRIELLAEHGVE